MSGRQPRRADAGASRGTSSFAGSLLVLAASVVIRRTGVFPRWLANLGIVAAIALLFDVVYLNILPLWVWVFVASVVMLMRREETATVVAERRSLVGAAGQ